VNIYPSLMQESYFIIKSAWKMTFQIEPPELIGFPAKFSPEAHTAEFSTQGRLLRKHIFISHLVELGEYFSKPKTQHLQLQYSYPPKPSLNQGYQLKGQ
jgi:hypothetical protein